MDLWKFPARQLYWSSSPVFKFFRSKVPLLLITWPTGSGFPDVRCHDNRVAPTATQGSDTSSVTVTCRFEGGLVMNRRNGTTVSCTCAVSVLSKLEARHAYVPLSSRLRFQINRRPWETWFLVGRLETTLDHVIKGCGWPVASQAKVAFCLSSSNAAEGFFVIWAPTGTKEK